MGKIVTLLLMTSFFAACSVSPKIVQYRTGQSDVPSLRELANGRAELVIIFVHGVGDHCPGYAFGGAHSWMSGRTLRALGIEKLPHAHLRDAPTFRTPIYVYSDARKVAVGAKHEIDGGTTRLGYLYTRVAKLGTLGIVPVEGVEITWSLLTYRPKTRSLDYDLTGPGRESAIKALKTRRMSCFGQWNKRIERSLRVTVSPPSRVLVNGRIKEEVLDQELSDAILYVGPYRQVLERAVAHGICDAITRTGGPALNTAAYINRDEESSTDCWLDADKAFGGTSSKAEYIIITHSLGSRIVYDVVRYLNGIDLNRDSPFAKAEGDISILEYFPEFTCRLGAVYMMANQLSLLGLGTRGPIEEVIRKNENVRSIEEAERTQGRRIKPSRPPKRCHNSWGRSTRTQFVAFDDTNDILSWGIVPNMDTRYFDFTTVYVNNLWWHWFGIYENPSVAHSGYFDNSEVWSLVADGTHCSVGSKACGWAYRTDHY